MSLATLKPKTQLALAILVPIVCIVLGAVLLWPYKNSLQRTSDELRQTQSTIQQKKRLISQAEAMAQGRSLALAVASPTEQEPIVFLRQFAALTVESGAGLVSVRATAPPPPLQGKPGSGAPATASAQQAPGASPGGVSPGTVGQGQRPVTPPTVNELTNEVTVEGKYSDILALIVRLENFERILSVSRCRIKVSGAQTYPKLQAIFTISRFVAAPEPPPAARTAALAQPSTGAR